MHAETPHPIQRLSKAGDLSPDCERMLALMTAMDDLISRVDGASPFEQFKDEEAFSLENRFLWFTGCTFSWLDPSMADIIVQWVQDTFARGRINQMERDLLITEASGSFRGSIERLASLALADPGAIKSHWLLAQMRAQRSPRQTERPRPQGPTFTPPKESSGDDREEDLLPDTDMVVGQITASIHAQPQSHPRQSPSPQRYRERPKPPANAAPAPQADRNQELKDTLIALARSARNELISKGDYSTLPRKAVELLEKPNLQPAVLAQLIRIYLEPKTRSDAPFVIGSVEDKLLELMLERIRKSRTLTPQGQDVMWNYRQAVGRRGVQGHQAAGAIDECFCRLPILNDPVAKDLIDNCLAEERYEGLNILLKNSKSIPERLLKRITVLTSDKETLFAIASRNDLTPDVARSLKKKADRLPDTRERTIILKRIQARAASARK